MPIIETPAGATELTELRTARSKVFQLANGKRRLVLKKGPVHYRDDSGNLQDISLDLSVEGGTGDIIADMLPYRFRKHQLGIGCDVEFRSGGIVRLALTRVNNQNFNRNLSYAFTRAGRRITFADVRTNLDIVAEIGRAGIKIFRVLKATNAPKTFQWAVEYDPAGEAKIDKSIRGLDNLLGQPRRALQVSVVNSVPQAVAGGRMRYFADETWTGLVRTTDPVTRIGSWTNDPIYPVGIDPDITEEIAADGDDGYQIGTTWYNNYGGTRFTLGNFGSPFHCGMRFTSVAVPQAATIDLAVLKLNVTGGLDGGGTLYGSDTDDSAAWATTTNLPSTQVKTTASTSLPRPGSTGVKSYDVTTIVQEIVDRAGWTSGNDMSLFALTYEVAGGYATFFEDFAAAGTDEPTLEIDYTEAGGGGLSIPAAMRYYLQMMGA